MGKPGKQKEDGLPDVGGVLDILEGRVVVDSSTLFNLIHDINPTGKRLPVRERRQLYRLKSRLQSLLVRSYSEHLLVVQHHRKRSLISIESVGAIRNACHALLHNLEADARAWVEARLEAGRTPLGGQLALSARIEIGKARPPRPRPPSRRDLPQALHGGLPRSVPQLLTLGKRAQECFDFDTARACFTRALRRSRGAWLAARPLLELLVDHLAADEEALEVGAELPPQTRAHGDVRLLLAHAAARREQGAQALELMQGLSSPRTVAIRLLLAESAMRREALREAEGHLEAARELDPVHPRLHDLEGRIAALRARERLPLEQELDRLLAAGNLEEAAARARELLQRWPRNAAATHALQLIEARRLKAQAQALLRQAEEAQQRGQDAAALLLLQDGLRSGVGGELRAEFQARIADIERREREQKEAARAGAVLKLLRDGHVGEGVAAYVALRDAQKEWVRRHIDLPHFAWLAEMRFSRGAAAQAAQAALALGQAEELCPRDPEGALALLGQHGRLLEPVPRSRRLTQEAQQLLQKRRQEQVQKRVQAAREALDRQELEPARALLDRLDLHRLPAEEAGRAQELRERLGRLQARVDLEQRFERHREARELFDARDLAGELAEQGGGAERERWRAVRREIVAEIQRSFRIATYRGPDPGPVGELCDPPRFDLPYASQLRLLLPSLTELCLLTCHDQWLYLRTVDTATGAVTARTVLRTPAPMDPKELIAGEDGLWVLGNRGLFLELSLPDLEVRRWVGATSAAAPSEKVLGVQLSSDGRFLWLSLEGRRSGFAQVRVVDLHRPGVYRSMGDLFLPDALLEAGGEARVCAGKRLGRMGVFSARGVLEREVALSRNAWTRGYGAHPSGRGLIALATEVTSNPADALPLVYHEVPPEGSAAGPGRVVDNSNGRRLAQLATALPQRLAFLYFHGADDKEHLLALQAGADGAPLTELYRVELPPETALLRDNRCRRALLGRVVAGGVEFIALGAEPPRFERPGSGCRRDPLGALLRTGYTCGRVPLSPELRAQVAQYEQKSGVLAAGALERMLREHGDEPEVLEALQDGLDGAGYQETALELARQTLSRHPDRAQSRLRIADAHLGERADLAALDVLHGAQEEHILHLAPFRRRHYFHLVALTTLFLGEGGPVRTALRAAERFEGPCDLEAIRELATPLPEPLADADWDPTRPPLRQLLGAIRTADERRAQGDAAGARRALDRQVVWYFREPQSLARLADAYLCSDDAELTGAERFRKHLVLSAYRAMHDEDECGLPLVSGAWDQARLTEVCDRCYDYLEAFSADGAELAPPSIS